MKNILLLFLITSATISKSQTPTTCKELIAAMPSMQQYKIYIIAQPPICDDEAVTTYYLFDKMDDEQRFMVMLQDTKSERKQGLMADALTKYEMAKTSKDKTALRLSRFKVGSKSFVSHDYRPVGLKRDYGYTTILKNRYILNIILNNNNITNLDQFENLIEEYVFKIKDGGLPDL